MTESKAQSAAEEPPKRHWLFAAAGALLLAAGGAAYYFLGPPSGTDETATPIQVAVAPRVDTVATPPPVADDTVAGIAEVAPPLSPEELETQVRSLVAERAGDLEANLKAEYDQRLVELRRQLEDARKTNVEPAQTAEVGPSATEPEPKPEPKPEAKEPVTTAAERPQPETKTPAQVAVARPQPAVTTPPAPKPEPQAAEEAPLPTPVATPTASSAPEPEPIQQAPVEAGSVVTAGPSVVSPTLVKQPSVVYPPAAARLKRRATIRMRVLVDENGRPSQVEQLSKKVGLGFDSAAVRAAQTTRWTPPTKDGVPVQMWVELSIDFRP